jgi:hypothetical protein
MSYVTEMSAEVGYILFELYTLKFPQEQRQCNPNLILSILRTSPLFHNLTRACLFAFFTQHPTP